jgi:hypothetical protein
MTSIAVPDGRRVVIDGHGRLHPADGDPIDIIADKLNAVIVLWRKGVEASWLGWLITKARCPVPFCAADLADPSVQSWLRALPAWNPDRLWYATTTPGVHMVWQRDQGAGG